MHLFEAVRLALAQIRVQKLKSFFTLLGVMIGVMFLIAVVSIVEGMGRYVQEGVAEKFLGVNTFNIRRMPDMRLGEVTRDEWRAWQRRPPITVDDADAVRAALPEGARWAMQDADWAVPKSAHVAGGPQVITLAATTDYFTIKDLAASKGRLFNDQEEQLGSPVVVIGEDVADHYFPGLDPIGRELRFGNIPFRVIGVLEKQGSFFGLNFDRQAIAPFHSPMRRLTRNPQNGLYSVAVQAQSPEQMANVQEIAREVMRRRRHLHPADKDNFALESSQSALSAWDQIQGYMVMAGVFLPAVGLVVGAIVIMNIMLVAVAERTREIGIRKSLGARRRDIMAQFLVESATLSVVGAAIGIALGAAMAKTIAYYSPLPASVEPWSVVVGVLLGAGVGIVAGAYPASRASRLDPITALRAE
ncbi:MAG: ABC transporter permease [Gemmatimonadaceae bacterium]